MQQIKLAYGNVKAVVIAALRYDSTRPMRVFILIGSLVLAIWLLLPGDSIGTPSTTLLRRLFGSDEVMSLWPLTVFMVMLIAEAFDAAEVKWLKSFAALYSALWWMFLGAAALLSRFNSLAGVFWLLVGFCALWVLWRNEH